ncbi:unnamed protein product [Fusarium graminearum]|uniref:Uncharacterized protein n=1 Tax=Gibberella zeae TaxID=5518 RepID=A0A679NHT9_GIBZA|nr:unnamed protein product [Fusarium graminearum]CAG1983627.1 unnamed protein product [Fusarium graminearum]CAG2015210.1 unnamed protein product [Fusarium graminearum]CZS76985.1 unnamed protein product [Fusarium graminearum]
MIPSHTYGYSNRKSFPTWEKLPRWSSSPISHEDPALHRMDFCSVLVRLSKPRNDSGRSYWQIPKEEEA